MSNFPRIQLSSYCLRFRFKNKVIVFARPLEFGDGTATEDLWKDGYSVHLDKFLRLKILVFTKGGQQ